MLLIALKYFSKDSMILLLVYMFAIIITVPPFMKPLISHEYLLISHVIFNLTTFMSILFYFETISRAIS